LGGLKDVRQQTLSYLKQAAETIDGLEGGWLDREEVEMIKEELGDPPPPCLPIYLISLRDKNGVEELVYVGITSTTNRFLGGHKVALRLHHPKFQQYDKLIYQCVVWLHFDDEYIALEWLEPEGLPDAFLESVEAQLIYHFQPRFNIQKKKKFSAKYPLGLHIQNSLGEKFLSDQMVFPP